MYLEKLNHLAVIRISGICGILLHIFFLIFIVLAIGQSPWFSWTQYALSDLGIIGTSSLFFNNGLVLLGTLALIFSIGMIPTLSTRIGGYIILVSSLSLIGVGLFPLSLRPMHMAFSVVFFGTLVLGFIVLGLTMRRGKFEERMGMLALVCSMVALSAPYFLIFFDSFAIPELLVFFPPLIWCMIYGIHMMLGQKATKKVRTPAIMG